MRASAPIFFGVMWRGWRGKLKNLKCIARRFWIALRSLAFENEGERLPPAPVSHMVAEPIMNPSLEHQLSEDLTSLAVRYSEKGVSLFPLSKRMIEVQNQLIANTILAFFSQTDSLSGATANDIKETVTEFRKVFLSSPITMNNYGANFPSGVNLFCLARHLGPTKIIESGVYKGQSSYYLALACRNAAVHAFDPNLTELSHRSPGVMFYANDWMNTDVKCQPIGSGLCFFDDHQNQALRIVQAYERGFRHILFDDSWPIEVVVGCGWPPLPSVDMVISDTLNPDETVEWVEGGKKWTYVHNQAMQDLCARARRLIKAAYEMPSLYRETGIAPTSAYKYVELNL